MLVLPNTASVQCLRVIISFLVGIVVGAVFMRSCFAEEPPILDGGEVRDIASTDTENHRETSKASSLAQGLKNFAGELVGTKPYGMNMTSDGLNQFCAMFEINHYGVIWECWTDGAHTLIGVDAPPLCNPCRTPLDDVDAKKWSCPNCNASYDEPPIGANPADTVAKIVNGMMRRNELKLEDARHIGTDLQCEF